MYWEKRGLIYCPSDKDGWKQQFAICPTPFLITKDRLRIFVNMCDENMVGRPGYVDVNPENFSEILEISQKPVLDVGRPGAFDDNGVGQISLLEYDGKFYMYYIGFQLGVKIPYYMFCGLAISDDGGYSFKKYSQTPILDRKQDELYARCGVHVIRDDGKFKMWYVGSYGDGWTNAQGKLKPLYTMKYLESDDGINWNADSITCMEYGNEDEHGFGRPYVWKDQKMYKMLYSIRTYSRGYYLGYAESFDGINWTRQDSLAGIGLSKVGWDSENLSYGHLFNYKGKTYLFYNGNGCGKTGFGYAELVQK